MMKLLLRNLPVLAACFLALAAGVIPVLAAGTPAGTNITNQATVDYTDGNGNPLQALSNIVTTTVTQVASVLVDPDRAANATPGDIIYYAHRVTNQGNGGDTIDLTAVSSNGWATALFLDADSSGGFNAGDVLLTDTDADLVVDTGALAADGFVDILARITVPGGVASGTVDTMTVTGTSSFNIAVFETATDTTTVNAPDLAVVKSVLPAGPQPPGTVLTYRVVVTNNGLGAALGVILTDPVPGFTNFVPGSITLDGISKTDIGGDDEGDFNATTPGAVTVSIGALAAGATATVEFQVTIQ